MESCKATVADLNAVLERTAFLAPYAFSVRSCAPGECVFMFRSPRLWSDRGASSAE